MRYIKRSTFEEITKTKPEKALVKIRKKTGGRNNRGRVTMRGIGGGAKQKIRNVDFKRRFSRKAFGEDATVTAKVIAIEYDPMRSARIALLEYEGGEKRYIIAPNKLGVGDSVQSGPNAEPEIGSAMPIKKIPLAAAIHNIELTPGRGGQIVRAAGSSATLMSLDGDMAQIKLPSGEIRRINENCWPPSARSATSTTKNKSSVKPVTHGIAAFVRSLVRWRKTLSITPWAVARLRPPVAVTRLLLGV